MLPFYNKNTTAIELLLKAPTTNILAGNRKPPSKTGEGILGFFWAANLDSAERNICTKFEEKR